MENNEEIKTTESEQVEEKNEGSTLDNEDSNNDILKTINDKLEMFENSLKEWVINLIESKKDNEEKEEKEEIKERDFING